jgi:hypothetical protein
MTKRTVRWILENATTFTTVESLASAAIDHFDLDDDSAVWDIAQLTIDMLADRNAKERHAR